MSCNGCGRPVNTPRPYHCPEPHYVPQPTPTVDVASRERLAHLRTTIRGGGLDADTLRAALLALIDEVMR